MLPHEKGLDCHQLDIFIGPYITRQKQLTIRIDARIVGICQTIAVKRKKICSAGPEMSSGE